MIPVIPLTSGRYVMRVFALSSCTCNREKDSFGIPSEDNFSRKLSESEVGSFLFQLNDDFPDFDRLMDWASLVEDENFLLSVGESWVHGLCLLLWCYYYKRCLIY